jgi:ATP-dependent DNA ligase
MLVRRDAAGVRLFTRNGHDWTDRFPLIARTAAGLLLNEHINEPGDVVFRHACKMGLEGIVSKRLGSRYRSGRSRHWIKSKNPKHPAVKREAEEDWAR